MTEIAADSVLARLRELETRNSELEARNQDLEQALHQNDQDLLLTFRFTPAQTNILGLLLSSNLVTTDMIRQRLRLATQGKTAIFRLRKLLTPWGIKISGRRNLGYWLEPEEKQKIHDLVDRTRKAFSAGHSEAA